MTKSAAEVERETFEQLKAIMNTPKLRGTLLCTGLGQHLVDEEGALALLAEGALPDEKDNDGNTPLIHATRRGLRKLVEALLKEDVDIDHRNTHGFNALIWAADCDSENTLEILRALLEKGPQLDLQNSDGHTALIYATAMGRKDSVRLIAQAGADIENIRNNAGYNALDAATSWRDSGRDKKGFLLFLLENELNDRSNRAHWAEQDAKKAFQESIKAATTVQKDSTLGNVPRLKLPPSRK